MKNESAKNLGHYPPRSRSCGCGGDSLALRTVWIRTGAGHSVEDHRFAAICGDRFPLRNVAVIGIARAGKVNPGLAHLHCQPLRFRAVAGLVRTALRVVKEEVQIGAMKCHRPAAENRRLPLEPEIISARLAQGRL